MSLPLPVTEIRQIVDDAIGRYIAERRAQVPAFVDCTFSFVSSLRLHRRALGWDLMRAPANVVLVLPTVLGMVSAVGLERVGARRAGRWLRERDLFLRTDVGEEIEWRLFTELLQLPIEQRRRCSYDDALARTILADPRVGALLGRVLADKAGLLERADVRAALERSLAAYAGTRAAAADLTNALVLFGTGAAALHKLTPGALTFGPALAAAAAQQAAVASFPLGSALGGAWYSVFPAKPTALLMLGSTAGTLLVASFVAAFAGVIADPVQRHAGLHQRRLQRLLDTLERNLRGDAQARFTPRDHYVTRLVDLLEIVALALRHAR